MRKGVEGLSSRYPLEALLPSLMREDDMTVRWMAGLDDVMTPLLWTLDSLEAYLDPRVAPMDFVEWLSGWVGAAHLEGLDEQTRRTLVAETAELYGMRGTVEGLRRFLQLTTHAEVISIDDGGGVTWTRDPSTSTDGMHGRPRLVVTVRGDQTHAEEVLAQVAAWCPAHVVARVEVAPA